MHLFKKLFSASLLGLGMLQGSSALAAPQTFVIDMDCADCADAAGLSSYPVQAVLTLDNYVPGTPITNAVELLSFSYSGSNLVTPFIVSDDVSATYWANNFFTSDGIPTDVRSSRNYSLSGNLSNDAGPNSLFFQFQTSFSMFGVEPFYFLTDVSGGWSMCAPGADGIPLGGSCLLPSDYGTNAVYTLAAVPEPSELAMLSAGLLLMGAAVRRSKAS